MKSYLILGATSDISVALATIASKSKSIIYLASRNVKDLTNIKNRIEYDTDSFVHLMQFDASKFDSHQSFYDSIDKKPDVVVSMFGYLGNQKNAENNFSEAKKIIEINYLGAVSILNIIANDFEIRESGVIVGVSSVSGDRGRQSNYMYGSAKAAFETYLSGLRNRLYKSSIHVCTVKPGFVDTRMTKDLNLPKLLTTTPDEVAKDILKAIKKKKNIIYTKWYWKYIMNFIQLIPEPIFKKLNL